MTTPLHALAAKWEARAACADVSERYEIGLCAAELRAALAEGGWQTMETAPTDDRDILWCEGPGKPVSVVNREHYGECFLHGLWQHCSESPQ